MSPLSFLYLAKEALEGDANSQYVLGCHYLRGDNVKKDPIEAIHWWTGAGNYGHKDAQYNLGALYLSMNKFEWARLWLEKANENGCYKSKDLLKYVESQMLNDNKNIK